MLYSWFTGCSGSWYIHSNILVSWVNESREKFWVLFSISFLLCFAWTHNLPNLRQASACGLYLATDTLHCVNKMISSDLVTDLLMVVNRVLFSISFLLCFAYALLCILFKLWKTSEGGGQMCPPSLNHSQNSYKI
jgi:hypothetical protein